MKSTFCKALFILTIVFSLNANAVENINPYDSIRATVSEKETISISPNTFLATFELTSTDAKQDNSKAINAIIKDLQKSKIQYSQSNNSAFSDINGKQSFKSVSSIYMMTKNYEDIKNKFPIFKKEGFKLAEIKHFVDSDPSEKQLNTMYNKAYKKAEEKAKLLANKLNGDFSIRRTYARKTVSDSKKGLTVFDTSVKDQKIDFAKSKPKTENISANITVFMKIQILPKTNKNTEEMKKEKEEKPKK